MRTIFSLIIIIVIIIIIISIFKEDSVFSIIAILPYGPPVNTDIDYYQTFFRDGRLKFSLYILPCNEGCAMNTLCGVIESPKPLP